MRPSWTYLLPLETLWIKLGDPDESLFEIPSHYVERSPSQVMVEAARRRGEPCRFCELSTTRQRNEAYASRQRPAHR